MVRRRKRDRELQPRTDADVQALLLPRDAGVLSVAIRQTERWDSHQVEEAIVFSSELSDELRTEDYFSALRTWFLEHGDPPREVEAARREFDIGASGLGATLIITLFGAAAGV